MIQNSKLKQYAADFMAFANDLHIPLGGSSGQFGPAMADFQRADFESLTPALHCLARGEVAPVRRFWRERVKGGSKDTDASIALLWLLAFANRPLRIQIGAYDSSQADEVRLIVREVLTIDAPLNRMLDSVIEVQGARIYSHRNTERPESVAEILTTDSRGRHGSRPDVVLINEVSHIGNQEFAETLFDNADKVPVSIVICATNAGFLDTWQHAWREIARESERWHFSRVSTPGPWISQADLDESKRRNPPARYRRLWEGAWCSATGDLINPADIDAAITLDGPQANHDSDWAPYIAGLDLGINHDHSALVVMSLDLRRRRYRLVNCESWRPPMPGGKVRLEEVKQACMRAARRYRLAGILADKWQAEYMCEVLTAEGVQMNTIQFTPKNCDKMATTLLDAFSNQKIDMYRDPALIRDLGKLSIVERRQGFKLEATRDEHGHCDRATAMVLALFWGKEIMDGMFQLHREPPPERLYA